MTNLEKLEAADKILDRAEIKVDELIDELEEYRYKEMTDERPQREDHFEGRDHSTDSLRYALHTHKPGDKGFLLLDDPEGLVF